MKWREEIVFIPRRGNKRAIVQGYDDVVVFVDCLDKDFVKRIIDKHNAAIDENSEKWVYEGISIMRKNNDKKENV